jgi:anaerobic magnesium-protoporphyrin IX monomethyl ester cyclase
LFNPAQGGAYAKHSGPNFYRIKMKILLIQPPVRDFYQTPIRTQPIGLSSLAAALVEKNHEVEILDCQVRGRRKKIFLPEKFSYIKEFFPEGDLSPFRLYSSFYHFGLSFDEILLHVKKTAPDLVGISCQFTPYVPESFSTAEVVKMVNPDIPVIFGGAHASVLPRSVLKSEYVDYIVIGEGERTFTDLVEAISEEKSVSELEGVGYREGAGIRVNPSRTYISDIDRLSFPARNLLDTEVYKIGQRKCTMLLTSRGCPQGCSYCSVATTMGTRFRTRSPQNVIAEMKSCVKDYDITAFDIEDDNFTLDLSRAEKILDLIIDEFGEQTIDLYAMNGLSIFSLTEDLLCKMKRAGFKHLDLALGSSSKDLNREMNRPADLSIAEAVLKQAARLGFSVNTYIILGIPGHRLEDMVSSILYLAEKDTFIGPSIFYPSPGTEVYQEMEKNGYVFSADFSMLRSSLFPVETEGFLRLDLVTLLRLARWVNFIKQLLLADINIEQLNNTAVLNWHPKDVPLCRKNDSKMYYLTVKEPLKMVDAGKILSSFFLQTKNFFGIRRIRAANKDLYTYQLFPYKTSQSVMDILFNSKDFFIRQAVSRT